MVDKKDRKEYEAERKPKNAVDVLTDHIFHDSGSKAARKGQRGERLDADKKKD